MSVSSKDRHCQVETKQQKGLHAHHMIQLRNIKLYIYVCVYKNTPRIISRFRQFKKREPLRVEHERIRHRMSFGDNLIIRNKQYAGVFLVTVSH